MRPIRVALSGKMRSGKDTLASELIVRHGFTRMAFADRLKELAAELFGASETFKNRALLQALSRKLCEVEPAVWIKYVVDRIPMDRSVVVTDLRYPNEYHTLKGLGFCLVRIETDEHTRFDRFNRTEGGHSWEEFRSLCGHRSETSLDGSGWRWDMVLDGTKSGADMYGEVRLLLEHLAMKVDEEAP